MTDLAAKLPEYDELPVWPDGSASAWGLFGPDDSAGLINLQTPERVAGAARLVRKGRVFPLDHPIDFINPPMFNRSLPKRSVRGIADLILDDELDGYSLQVSSQWDSLAHVGARPNGFYNGVTYADAQAGLHNTVDHWARRGIVGRAVLLDVPRALHAAGVVYSPNESRAITVDELELSRRKAGVEFQTGDVLLLRTGFAGWYTQQSEATRADQARAPAVAGLEHSGAMARYLWNTHVCAIGADNPSVEVWPPDFSGGPFGFLHRTLIGRFGMALGELWNLDALAADCAADGINEMLFASAPLNVTGGIGSPANALAIK
jgi:kynurenine formamidase